MKNRDTKFKDVAEEMTSRPDLTQPLATPEQALLPNVLREVAQKNPDAVAVRQDGQTWSYGELIQCADAVAHALLLKGLRKGEVVAVYGPKSFGLLAAMIAVFRSGGILLAIDKNLPPERRKVMLGEASAKYIVSADSPEAMSWLGGLEIETVSVDPLTGQSLHPENSKTVPFPLLAQDDPAYVFFTSGTTGMPKGVLGSHKGLAHFLTWQRETFDVGSSDRAAQLTALSFDVVLRDIFLPLTSGATLCLPPDSMHVASEQILSWLSKEKITVVHTTPTLAQHWLGRKSAKKTPPLRYAFFAGEPLMAPLVRQWRKVFPDCEIINLYGPTETTLAKFFYRVPTEPAAGVQPLGHPLPQTQAVIMSDGRLCPEGEPGEIVIRTPFRSHGYINATPEDQKRFLRNPYRDDDTDLLYCTGDRGCIDGDGLLTIRGRVDDQVKIRGERVEPSEVTAVLMRHRQVRAAFTMARKNDREQAHLVAYVVPQKRSNRLATELRLYLRERLPVVMIPSAFVLLDELPLTPNGKVDRKALPEPEFNRHATDETYVAPRTEDERKLVEIWQRVMKISPIGIRDDFYELGGYSLLAVELFEAINAAFQKNFAIDVLFRAPTVEKLAVILREEEGGQAESAIVAIQPHGDKLPFYCIPGVRGGLLYFRKLSHYLGREQPFYGLRPRGTDGKHAPYTDLVELAADYVAKIRSVQPEGPYQIGGHSFGCGVAYEVAQQLCEQGAEVRTLAFFNYLLTPRELWAGNTRWGILKMHAHAMSKVKGWERIWYILNTLALELIRSKPFQQMYKHYRQNGKPLPRLVRPFHVLRLVNIAADRAYQPRPYPGKIILFAIEENPHDFEKGLPGLAEQGFEVNRVAGDHNTMLDEPHVRTLARKLEPYLSGVAETQVQDALA